MAENCIGWIKVYRTIWDNEIWDTPEPFTYRSAWVDLILLMNHEDKTIVQGATAITVKRGQHKTSMLKLSQRWHRSRAWVSRFLTLLQKLQMITFYADSHGVLITLINYEKYQINVATNEQTESIEKSSRRRNRRATNSTTNVTTDVATSVASDVAATVTQTRSKEYKEVKEDKNIYRLPPGVPNPEEEEWQ